MRVTSNLNSTRPESSSRSASTSRTAKIGRFASNTTIATDAKRDRARRPGQHGAKKQTVPTCSVGALPRSPPIARRILTVPAKLPDRRPVGLGQAHLLSIGDLVVRERDHLHHLLRRARWSTLRLLRPHRGRTSLKAKPTSGARPVTPQSSRFTPHSPACPAEPTPSACSSWQWIAPSGSGDAPGSASP